MKRYLWRTTTIARLVVILCSTMMEVTMDGSDNESVDEGYDQEAGGYSNANEGFYDVVDIDLVDLLY